MSHLGADSETRLSHLPQLLWGRGMYTRCLIRARTHAHQHTKTLTHTPTDQHKTYVGELGSCGGGVSLKCRWCTQNATDRERNTRIKNNNNNNNRKNDDRNTHTHTHKCTGLGRVVCIAILVTLATCCARHTRTTHVSAAGYDNNKICISVRARACVCVRARLCELT